MKKMWKKMKKVCAAALAVFMVLSLEVHAAAAQYTYSMVIKGKTAPWLFFGANDGQPMETYQRTNLFTESELKRVSSVVGSLAADLNAEGIQLILLIAPDKEEVYGPEYMPERYKVLDNEGCTRQFINYMNTVYPDIPVLYPLEELNEAKTEFENVSSLYYESDTHWNMAGGFVGARTLLEQIAKSTGMLYAHLPQTKSFYNAYTRKGDLQIYAKLGAGYDCVEYSPTTAYASQTTELHSADNDTTMIKAVSTSEGAMPLNVWLVGDSFRHALTGYLQEAVEQSTIINRYYFDPDLMMQDKPDVVVYEIVERYLHQLDYIPGYNTMAKQIK